MTYRVSRFTIVNSYLIYFFFFQAEDGIRDYKVTGVQTCALPIYRRFLLSACAAIACSELPWNGMYTMSLSWAMRAPVLSNRQCAAVRSQPSLSMVPVQ